jgi:epoxyqueuosine reductase
LTIELRSSIPEEFHSSLGTNVFGCDICQEVCPWNSGAPLTGDAAFAPLPAPQPEEYESLTEKSFRAAFEKTPVSRAKYSGFLRNAKIVAANQRTR